MVTYWRRDYIHGLMFHACGTNVYVDIKIVLEVSEIRAINNHYLQNNLCSSHQNTKKI